MSTAPDWETAEDVFRKSYDEVLAAIKHQDDKLGRVLTVLSFLTAAGVALFGHLHSQPAPISSHLWQYLLIAFLANIAAAVLFALAGVDPTSLVPDKAAAADQRRVGKSLVFYELIARDRSWDDYVKDPTKLADLKEDLARNLHEDARILAHRVRHKIERSNESQAFLQVAVVCLVLFGVFALSPDSTAGWWSAFAVLVPIASLPIVSIVSMRIDGFPGAEATWVKTASFFLAATVLVAADLLIARRSHHEAIGLAIALVLLVMSRIGNVWFARLVT